MCCLFKYFIYFLVIVGFLAVGLFIYFLFFQPAFNFPRPTGKYAVGVKTYHWVDNNRKEIFGNDFAHPNRELMVTVWYPAQGKLSEKPIIPYVPYRVDYFRKNQKMNLFSKLFYCPVYSYAGLESSICSENISYPVVIFSPGCGCTRDAYTAQCEELASHGYVVVGVGETYFSSIVQFPNGRAIDGIKSVEERWKNKNFVEICKQIDQEIEIWISDISFVLDQLEMLNNDKKSIFYNRLDQKNIGVVGHSTGGGAAAQICRRDPRVKAGIALDGFLFGPDAQKGFNKPFMFLFAGNGVKLFERDWTKDEWLNFNINSLEDEKIGKSYYLPASQLLAKLLKHDVYTYVINDAGHLDFGDITLFKKASHFWRTLMMKDLSGEMFNIGSIVGLKATKIVNDYLVSFLNKYLKGKSSDLLDGNGEKYSEVLRN